MLPPPAPGGSPDAPAPGGGIRLVALDMDGTLLRSDKNISKRNAAAIAAATAQGVKVVLATARPPRSVRPLAARLGLDTWQMNYNGALIHDPVLRRHVHHQPLSLETAQAVVTLARKIDPGVVVSLEILDRWYTDHFDPELPTETSKTFMPDVIAPLEAILRTAVTKVMLLAPPQRLEPITLAVREEFAGVVSLAISDQHLLQVTHPHADKGRALARIAEHYQVARREVMAVGDAPNDLAMVRWAGLGVAVGNAWPQLKAQAKAIVADNDHDGVAQALEKFVLA